MKAWIISDLHFTPMDNLWSRLRIPEADVCVCAGDITGDVKSAMDFLRTEIEPHMPVITVLGNHEYYGRTINEGIGYSRKWASNTDIHPLENSIYELGDVKFIGATLWTDFEIATGADDENVPAQVRLEKARTHIRHHAIDCTEIKSDKRPGEFIDVDELRERHFESVAFIKRELMDTPISQKTVVLTHHAPLTESLDWRFDGRLNNAAYASDLSKFIRSMTPHYWIHGHIHRFLDYEHSQTRIICNPRGLGPSERDKNGFKPDFVIDL